MFKFSIYIKNKRNLLKIARILSKFYFSGFILYTIGRVGIGKTNFIKSLIGDHFCYKYDIKSPTYSFVESYNFFNLFFHHFDLYRLQKYDNILYTDMTNYLNTNSVLLFEWGDKLFDKFFFAHICIFFFNYSHLLNRFILLKSHFINIEVILKC